MTTNENTLPRRYLEMRILFSSRIFSPWALRPSASYMFTHIARYRKFRTGTNMLNSHVYCQSQLIKLEELWYQRFIQQHEENEKQLQEMRGENWQLLYKVLYGYTEKMMQAHNFNVRGALVFNARLDKKIDSKVGTQKGLNELAQKTEFKEILDKEVQERHLVYSDVEQCFPHLYDHVSMNISTNGYGNDCMIIVIRVLDFSPNERAALVALLKLQKNWYNPLGWQEVVMAEE
ncbi:hypothetical protein HOY82DRAFT_537014 [Tuber indicum]|nr:hypothetical protein HOY82DRAFT_537014 [Tuber indicum]